MSNSFKLSDENEFLGVHLQQSKMKGSRSMSTDVMIQKLEEKNTTLKRQVKKIQRVLSSMKVQQKPRYGITLPQIKPDTIKKQLQNAYKQIKIYQYQIQKRRNVLSSQTAYVEQINKTQKLYKQKIQMHQKLKRQMLTLKYESKQLIKQLKNNQKQQDYQNLQNKLATDIKYLQQKIREFQIKRTINVANLQRQRASIKEMQAEILQDGSSQILESIKARIFKANPQNGEQNDILSPSRSIIDIENDAAKQQSRFLKPEDQPIQDRTPQAYNSLLNDSKLLKKMQNDYDLKMNLLTKERDLQSQKNFRSRNKLLEVQFEIEAIQKSIQELKKMIDPNMFKPKLPKVIEKKKQLKKKQTIIHNYKYLQAGQISKFGKRFSDRATIGKVNSRIVSVTIYQRQEANQIIGIQASYKTEDGTIKKGGIHTRLDMKKQTCKQQTLKLQGDDFFKTIDVYTKKSKLSGINLVSYKNKVLKCGDITGKRQLLQMKELQYPMCFFGSLLEDGLQCFGIQIYQDPNAAKQSQDS